MLILFAQEAKEKASQRGQLSPWSCLGFVVPLVMDMAACRISRS